MFPFSSLLSLIDIDRVKMRLKSVLIISTFTALTCASSFPSGLNFGAGAGSSERNDPNVEVLLNGLDSYRLSLIGGAGQISLTENPQLRRTSIGLYSNDGGSKSGNGRSDRINGLNQDNDRFRIFRFGSIFRAGNRIRSGRKSGTNGENREEDDKDKDENVDSSNEDDATSENIVDDDDDNPPRSPVSLYPLATAEIVKGPQQLKCVITALPDHQPWVLGVFTAADPLRLISSPSAEASDSSPADPPPGTGASELWCFISYQDVMQVLISLDILADDSATSNPELSSSPSAQAPTPPQTSQTTQLIPLTIFELTQAQGVINMPIPSSPSSPLSSFPPDDATTVISEVENEDENQKPSSSSPPQSTILRTAAVIEGPSNLTCRIIYYSSGRSGPLQGQGFSMTKSLEMADTAIEGARYVYCDDVPMDEYVGDMPFMPS